MINKNVGLIIIIICLIYLVSNKNNKNEEFVLFYESSPSTRNMSYDLRCEPKIQKKEYIFSGSEIEPNYKLGCR